MKLNLSGVAFGALMVGLVAAGSAKADSIAYASLVFNSAFFSQSGSSTPLDLTSSIDLGSLDVGDTLKNTAALNGVTASTVASRNALTPGIDAPLAVEGSYSGGQNNFGFTGTNTNFARSDSLLTGNLLAGNVSSSVVAETQVVNNNTGNVSTASTSNSQVSFKATSNFTGLVFNVGGALALYTDLYNSSVNQFADATAAFSITLTDQETGVAVLSFSPGSLNTGLTDFNTPSSKGSTTASSFSLTSNSFDIVGGDTYTLQINQTVQADATAVPEPATLGLFGIGLAGIGFLGFRRQKKTGGLAA